MFGKVKLRDNMDISLGGKTISISRVEDYYVYLRDEVERVIVGDEISILPEPARGYGVKLMMIRLESPIAIAPGKVLRGFIEVPIDVSVRTGSSEIDRFGIGREKYALYGTLENGVIVRYVRAKLESNPRGVGNLKLIVLNNGNNWGFIDRVVFPMMNIMYYSSDMAFYPTIRVEIEEDINVVNTGEAPLPNLYSTGEEKSLRFKMRW
ncbi:DUF432 domain-containing protein [Pyrococcus abyssi]|uniref:DUF432 domain-containing protein n=1 Tax=Pyrococcus abyssi (strain GE5 / Orsay) TaxID=272844 RepID=Q9UY81_PYRAB|nr:DUF432 domain-containing protein [Pyrococcus abyssi]CAB50531.1 Hypothetical protein PAB1280 [Pyrococcus abyssi GE5]CCE71088.1 TPA: hypothetical protein PAB1280 [Pyrococcus abyssi GE5]